MDSWLDEELGMIERQRSQRATRRAAVLRVVLGGLFLAFGLVGPPAYAAAPVITTFSPQSGVLGTTVTITGTGFTSPASVQFNGVTGASTVLVSSTKITSKVPSTATSGPISVVTGGGSSTTSSNFTVVPGLVISGTAGGQAGANVSLSFSGFDPYEAVDVYFDSTDLRLLSATSAGAGALTLTTPATASSGQHWITAIGRHSGSAAQVAFVVRTDWPTSGFGPGRTSYNPLEHTLGVDDVDNLELGWQSAQIAPAATPVIARGMVFVGGGDNVIRAFDVDTGVQKWTRTATSPVGSGATVAAGVVYVGTDDGHLYALDAATGAVKWIYSVPFGGGIHSAPVVVKGIVYFGARDGYLHALNASTGGQVWAYDIATAVDFTPAVVGGTVFVTTLQPAVLALNAATGAPKWTRVDTSSGAGYASSPIVMGGLLYVGSINGTFSALHASDGSLAWTYQTSGAIRTTAAAAQQTVYVGDESGTVYAIRAGNSQAGRGVLRWSQTVESGPLRQALAVANGVVYAGGFLTRTWALDTATGEIAAIVPASTIGGGPAIVDGTVTIDNSNFSRVSHYVLPEGSSSRATRPSPASLRPDRSLQATTQRGVR